MKILVKTAGRSGSHIITDYLANYYNFSVVLDEHYAPSNYGRTVVHSQLDFIPDDPENWIFVNSKRKSLFDQAISRRVGVHTKQWTEYTKIPKKNEVVYDFVSLLDSIGGITYTNDYHDYLSKKYKWKNTFTFFYEDIKTDQQGLNILCDDKPNYMQKKKTGIAPYNYSKIVKDYNILKEKYNEYKG
jgi:hypothetical protein